MRVLIVSQYYTPENAYLVPSLAKALSRRGHDVRVLTGYPNYPHGRLFDGYRQSWRDRRYIDGIDVLRVPLFIDHSQSALRRALNYLTFGISSSTAGAFARNADVVYVYATQMTAALGPWLWRRTGSAPFVLHIQDLWPDSITGSSLVSGNSVSRLVEKLLGAWLRSVYRDASAVIGIAPTMLRTLQDRGVTASKTHLIFNWAAEPGSDKSRTTLPPLGKSAPTEVLYAGNVGDLQDLDIAVRAASAVRKSGVRLTIVGDGIARSRVQSLATDLGASNVTFRDSIPRRQMSTLYSEFDFALVTLRDLPAFRGTIPSKFQAALAHGLPVITNVQGDLRVLVEDRCLGFTAEPSDLASLEAAFRAATRADSIQRSVMAEAARDTYCELFSESAAVGAIEAVLKAAAYPEFVELSV